MRLVAVSAFYGTDYGAETKRGWECFMETPAVVVAGRFCPSANRPVSLLVYLYGCMTQLKGVKELEDICDCINMLFTFLWELSEVLINVLKHNEETVGGRMSPNFAYLALSCESYGCGSVVSIRRVQGNFQNACVSLLFYPFCCSKILGHYEKIVFPCFVSVGDVDCIGPTCCVSPAGPCRRRKRKFLGRTRHRNPGKWSLCRYAGGNVETGDCWLVCIGAGARLGVHFPPV